ncbi:AAA family ATPase [Mangrovicella endophytica]|uniref:AAA family ATPase n=1 Tax=Mangrovicella endophytica TaxID=2066697 RepID=UPI001FDEBC27|nr:AAA family ATPase [Mangrovicella endophytica]
MTRAAPIDRAQNTDAEAPEDVDLAVSLIEEQTKIAQEAVDALRPSALIAYRTILNALPQRTRDALASRRPQLIVLRLASEAWSAPITDAVETITIAICGTSIRMSQHYSPSVIKTGRRGDFTADAILKDLYSETVCCLIGPGDALPDQITPFVDFDHKIGPLSPDDIRGAVIDRFPNASGTWPDELCAEAVAPDVLDLVLRKGVDADDAYRLLRATYIERRAESEPGDQPRLEDLHGYGQAREWGLQLVSDLAAFRAGRITWADVDSGCLLVGPPGTGKTLFAAALAHSAGCAFLPTSYAEWQSSKSGHLGDLMKKMRQVFEDAASHSPSIVFIDEIDTLPARGRATSYDDWWRSITNGLLECLDGASRREGVIILAACNDGRNLDPALVRSGRLDRRFRIELPDEQALAGIIRSHLGNNLADDFVQPIATALAGTTSGADVVRIARDARRIARLAGRDVAGEDLLAAALPPETRPAAVLKRVAIHEAGHAVVYMLFGGAPSSLSIVRDAENGGGVTLEVDEATMEGRRRDIEAMIVPILAGRAAEEIILGSVSAGAGGADSSDLARATTLLMQIEAQLGLGRFLSFGQQVDGVTVEIGLRRLYAEAMMMVARHRGAIAALAQLALEKRVLGRAALEAFAKTHLV